MSGQRIERQLQKALRGQHGLFGFFSFGKFAQAFGNGINQIAFFLQELAFGGSGLLLQIIDLDPADCFLVDNDGTDQFPWRFPEVMRLI